MYLNQSQIAELEYDATANAQRTISVSGDTASYTQTFSNASGAGAVEGTATGTITDGNGTNVSDGDTVTVGTVTYRFKNTMAQANDVKISTTADLSLTNLVDAINGTGSAGTNWYTGTVAQTLLTAGAVTSHATTLTAGTAGSAANAIVLTSTAASLTLNAGGTLTGGADAFIPLFTVTGSILCTLVGMTTTSLTGASAVIQHGYTGAATGLIGNVTATTIVAPKLIDSTGLVTPGTAPKISPSFMISNTTVGATVITDPVTAGVITYYLFYTALTAGATVVAA